MNELDQLALNQAKISLSAIEGVEVTGDWVPVNSAHSIFMLPLQLELVDTLPGNDIPKHSTWSLVIDFDNCKWGKVKIYPSLEGNPITNTYPHQQYNGGVHQTLPVRNGDICTLSSIHGLSISKKALASEPENTIEKITWHVIRSLEWLKSAATASLVTAGDDFELPDFGLPGNNQIWNLGYNESEGSFNTWKALSGQGGIALVSALNNTIIIRRFMNKNGKRIVYEPEWGSDINKLAEREAIWVCLNQVPVINNWQVPSTLQELLTAASLQGIDISSVIKGVLENFIDNTECFVLIGMPISDKINGAPFRYHWQGFTLPPAGKIKYPKIRAQLIVNHLSSKKPINWFLESENWNPNDLQNRGRLDKTLLQSEILLIGSGALGSNIAEQLIRMGVSKMTIIDKELFGPGNLVRHTLNMNDINKSKAVELANHLNQINPSATVIGAMLSIPTKDKTFKEAVATADLLIDCSADDEVMSELSSLGLKRRALIISCSTGLYADKLFFYSNTAGSFSDIEFNAWFQPYRNQEHLLAQQAKLPRGAGCWNPVTPAKLSNIVGLSAIAVTLIEQLVSENIMEPIALCHQWEVPHIKLSTSNKAA